MRTVRMLWGDVTLVEYLGRLFAVWLIPMVLTVITVFHRAILVRLGLYLSSQSDLPLVALVVLLVVYIWGSLELSAHLQAFYVQKTHGRIEHHNDVMVASGLLPLVRWFLMGLLVGGYMMAVAVDHIRAIFRDAKNGNESETFHF